LIQNKVRFFLFILLFCCVASVFSVEKKVIVYDTSSHIIRKASIEKEKEIFADKDFIYNKDAKESKSWWEAFLDWLSRLLGKSIDKTPNFSYNILKYTFITAFIFYGNRNL